MFSQDNRKQLGRINQPGLATITRDIFSMFQEYTGVQACEGGDTETRNVSSFSLCVRRHGFAARRSVCKVQRAVPCVCASASFPLPVGFSDF